MKILIIEDEIDLSSSIAAYIESNGMICEKAENISVAIQKINLYDYDCILLDLMLPDGNGVRILETLKKQGKTDGVIIISAKDSIDSRIQGLNLGADDYLTKPFHLSELLARINALIRRKNFKGSNLIVFKEIEVDLLLKTTKVNGREIDLTKKELDLLLFLMGNNNKVLSKGAIAEHLSGDMADMLNSHDFIYSHIKNLKKKIHEAGGNDYIKTIYGLGYKWQE